MTSRDPSSPFSVEEIPGLTQIQIGKLLDYGILSAQAFADLAQGHSEKMSGLLDLSTDALEMLLERTRSLLPPSVAPEAMPEIPPFGLIHRNERLNCDATSDDGEADGNPNTQG